MCSPWVSLIRFDLMACDNSPSPLNDHTYTLLGTLWTASVSGRFWLVRSRPSCFLWACAFVLAYFILLKAPSPHHSGFALNYSLVYKIWAFIPVFTFALLYVAWFTFNWNLRQEPARAYVSEKPEIETMIFCPSAAIVLDFLVHTLLSSIMPFLCIFSL